MANGPRLRVFNPRKDGKVESDLFLDGVILDQFIADHGADFRYVARWNEWLRWDGRRWRREETMAVIDLLTQTCADIARDRKRPISGSRVRVTHDLVKARREVARTTDAWDRNPLQINTTNGTLDLETGELHPWRPEDHLTKLAGAAFTGADCPMWKEFIHTITNGNFDLQAYLQRMSGYFLTGLTSGHAYFFAHGGGANGKSVFINVLRGVLGDYATSAPSSVFLAQRHEKHPTELADLRGYRLVAVSELPSNARWNEERINALTGGDKIKARFMRENFFEYTPQFKLLIVGNHKPGLRNINEANRRRLHMLPFTVRIPEHERVADYDKVLLADERDGILGWMVEGFQDWRRQGLDPPEIVRAATREYFEAQDVLAQWIGERCEQDRKVTALTRELFSDWKAWVEARGEFADTEKAFAQRLEERGFAKWRQPKTGRMGFLGLCLLSFGPMGS